MSKTKKNVVVFGEAGSGKSSIVNLLLGQDKANVSDQAIGCTFTFRKFETPNFNLYDTVGLSEGDAGTVKQEVAIVQLLTLLKSLEDGVSLLLFVIEKGRIKKSLNENYKLFAETICMGCVPIVLVITRCEMEIEPGTWWKENKEHFDKYGMTFNAVVSGCALQPSAAPVVMQNLIKEKNNYTAEQLLKAINETALTAAWKVEGGWSGWFFSIIKGVCNILIGSGSVLVSNFKNGLVKFFQSEGYDDDKAEGTVERIQKEIESK